MSRSAKAILMYGFDVDMGEIQDIEKLYELSDKLESQNDPIAIERYCVDSEPGFILGIRETIEVAGLGVALKVSAPGRLNWEFDKFDSMLMDFAAHNKIRFQFPEWLLVSYMSA